MTGYAYLDCAATTPLDPRVRTAMEPWLGERFGNPSSRHAAGGAAREALEQARARVAAAVAVRTEQVLFTSGGTEANVLAVLGAARARRPGEGRHILLGPTEHACVRAAGAQLAEEGFEVESARLDARGDLDLEDLAARARPDTIVCALMLVNNEFGTVYDVRRAAARLRARAPRVHLHVDAVQALGKVDCALAELGADSIALSGHKVHGPQGSGALVLARGARVRPLLPGGGQEGGLRGGTENVAAAVGFGLAAELAEREREATSARLTPLREHLAGVAAGLPGARILEAGRRRVPAILALLLPGIPAEVRMHHLEAEGVLVSAGSACQARKGTLSPALLALGLTEEEARSVLRFSMSRSTTEAEVERAARALCTVETALRG